jgi:hypothetical protein
MLEWVDEMWALLFDIGKQLDDRQIEGLRERCQKALRMWNQYESILAGSHVLEEGHPRKQRPADIKAAAVRAILEAGAAGWEG